MSQPSLSNAPDSAVNVSITIHEAEALCLIAIALTELSLAHVMHSEAKKTQRLLAAYPQHEQVQSRELCRLLLNDTASLDMMQSIIKQEMLLQSRVESIVELYTEREVIKHVHAQHSGYTS
ncbi:hypothetical protein JJQ72_15290 [Paenibacillus sp. F411]|uniref:Uncharacterized protein n=1 Tax=Paenibacillus algicola TaxID=2565926 RepID=A0A4P8XG87_9BACL|nr:MULTISPECIES: hypothetical protein [Paenibacillus]MBO2945339.1 hypothetical protein [Paenibacillus sp. F411]QCT01305.1 hypothetical protein E6C60_0582 [Paenibacillus algicola]